MSSELQQALEALAQTLAQAKPVVPWNWLPVAQMDGAWAIIVDQAFGRDWNRFTVRGRPVRAGSVTHRLLGAVARIAPRLDCTMTWKTKQRNAPTKGVFR